MGTDSSPTAETSKPKLRWFHATPGRLLVVLLAVEGILFLSERWFPKGWAVLIAIASVIAAMVLMLLWFTAALLFRWRFQYGLRSLLLLVVIVAVPCSWLATEMQQARKQKEAVEAILKLGGWVRVTTLLLGQDCTQHGPDQSG